MTTSIEERAADQVRSGVAAEYARKAAGAGCGDRTTAGQAGYRAADLEGVPDDVVAGSFGCGDPVAMADLQPGETVVDLGSGGGLDLILAARRVGPAGRAIGVDLTRAMVERARRNLERAGLAQAEVRRGTIEDLPVASGSVDRVISNCVVNLSPEKPRVFAEVARVLRPGGRMVISDIVVDRSGVPGWLRALASWLSPAAAGALDEAKYLETVRAAGLVDVEVLARLVYDRATLDALLRDELLGAEASTCPVSRTVSRLRALGLSPLLARAARALDGKVASIKVAARRPA